MRDVYAQPMPSSLKLLVFVIDLFNWSVIVRSGTYPLGSHAENLAGQLVVRLGMKSVGWFIHAGDGIIDDYVIQISYRYAVHWEFMRSTQEQDSEHCIRFDYFIYSIIIIRTVTMYAQTLQWIS